MRQAATLSCIGVLIAALPLQVAFAGDGVDHTDKSHLIPVGASSAVGSALTLADQASSNIVIPRDNCGTVWTGQVKDAQAVNPCPAGCERGEQLQLNEYKGGDTTVYEANYQCYLPKMEIPQPTLKMRAAGAPPRENCGTMWTDWQSTPNSEVNPCPANCERGELRLVNRSLSNGKPVYEMNYQCYTKEPESTRLAVTQPKPEPQGGIKEHPREAFRPQVITTEAMQLNGMRRPPFVPMSITTEAMQLNGMRRPPFVPMSITTEAIQLTGTRLHTLPVHSDRPVTLQPGGQPPSR